jgi:hypothetical protein
VAGLGGPGAGAILAAAKALEDPARVEAWRRVLRQGDGVERLVLDLIAMVGPA